jgi:serine/threonine protein kinase
MTSIAEAAYIAFMNFAVDSPEKDLDSKIFLPKPMTAYGSSTNLHEIDDASADGSLGVWSQHSSNYYQSSEAGDNYHHESEFKGDDSTTYGMPPTWEPVESYSYPVVNIKPTGMIPDNLTLSSFSNLKHIADGSNSNVYSAMYYGEKVIIKMLSEQSKTNKVAVHEFDVEHGILCRISHPNIIKILGAGREPRRFIVMEFLDGESLSTTLNSNNKQGLARKLFHTPTFPFPVLLGIIRDIAEALHYLHHGVHEGATIIHRDLKPDNIGFTSDGQVKLFDFGLCTCVKERTFPTEVYQMSGCTGSLRYMAPEVALKMPYCEKTDVYAFGILVWQMAKDKTPFTGMNRQEFMLKVVDGGERPKIDKSWPKEFSDMLQACWHENQHMRPSFGEVISILNSLNPQQIKSTMAKSKSFTPQTTKSAAQGGGWF